MTFIGLVLAFGGQYLGRQVDVAIAIDLVMVAIFIVYLLGVRERKSAA